jgi:hypothetical protein
VRARIARVRTFFPRAILSKEKIFFGVVDGRNFNAIREFAPGARRSSTRFPNNSEKPL